MSTLQPEDLANLTWEELVSLLQGESKAQSAWTVFYHEAVADRLDLNVTDHKCLDIILKSQLIDTAGPVTPSQLARLTHLTSGAVTGVLDRLEHAGFVKREHDPDDRRRIIVRADPECIHREIAPIFDWLAQAFRDVCAGYSEEELRLLIGFARKSQLILQHATQHLRALEDPPTATV